MSAALAAARPGLTVRGLGALKTLVFGTFFCLSPVMSIIALGWMVRRMGAVIDRRTGGTAANPTWILGRRGRGFIVRLLGGLGANIRTGIGATIALFLYSAPFALVWLGAWWAGWQNSFTKGYEQAFVGPTVFLTGIAIGMVLMAHLPFALAHFAVEGRIGAVFEVTRIRALFTRAGWRAPWLMFLTFFFALPVFVGRAWPILAVNFGWDLDLMTSGDVAELAGRIDLAMAAYTFVALLILRHLAATTYARALTAGRPALPLRILWPVLCLPTAFGLFFLILAAQFLNFAWWQWIMHPFLFLPWAG